MKRVVFAAAICAIFSGNAIADQMMDNTAEARGIVKSFLKNLKGELQKGMKSGGPVNAIEVCNTKAPGIARDASQNSGWDVARTSLKLRNPSNKPDTWELKALNDFEARKAAGEDPTKMEHTEVVEVNGQKTFRYMKAIPTGDVCLHCHGTAIKEPVVKKLDMLYPADKARGFNKGDLRGAFTLSKTL
ncbi:Tll0287-like domain-containing protein [Solemya velesiana gill symbiont]|uniref:Tll0287-like domain-containing protein n=1 Tax=Solemya velesiana gill symbiont TaxID=1918948 RepID=A0A1T2KY59_9GAMM|nr:DUF3365 domain-containing protein [Solemya velesiana gill symbiont]OOZ37741.1 hypothetical protein BOW51_01005 [Solemya velesiana gill symbiont]